jgi:hypothetical protein
MNTNIITHRLAKVVGLETKGSLAFIKKDRGALHSIKMGLATAVLFASGGMATAQPLNHFQADGTYQRPLQVTAPSRWDRIHFDHSGTRGREGLGAIPRCSISRREAGPRGEGACYYVYNRNGVRD